LPFDNCLYLHSLQGLGTIKLFLAMASDFTKSQIGPMTDNWRGLGKKDEWQISYSQSGDDGEKELKQKLLHIEST
jgi:hypothetical protein